MAFHSYFHFLPFFVDEKNFLSWEFCHCIIGSGQIVLQTIQCCPMYKIFFLLPSDLSQLIKNYFSNEAVVIQKDH